MTEEEKIFAGKLFDARTKELRDIKHKAHILCQKFNQMDEYDPCLLYTSLSCFMVSVLTDLSDVAALQLGGRLIHAMQERDGLLLC